MMALMNNQDDPRMKPLHGQTEFAYMYCLLWTDAETIHNSGLTHAAVDSFLQLIILGKVRMLCRRALGMQQKLQTIFFQLVRAFLCAGMDVCCTIVNKQIQQSASNETQNITTFP